MTNFTKLELDILEILADHHEDGEWMTEDWDEISPHPDTWELTTDGLKQKNNTIFSAYDLDPKVYRAVIASLIKKEAIQIDYYDVTNARFQWVEMAKIGISKCAFYKTKETFQARKNLRKARAKNNLPVTEAWPLRFPKSI
jgi:hypothetical protein